MKREILEDEETSTGMSETITFLKLHESNSRTGISKTWGKFYSSGFVIKYIGQGHFKSTWTAVLGFMNFVYPAQDMEVA